MNEETQEKDQEFEEPQEPVDPPQEKAIFVVCGFSQKEGIDYEETFAPIARYTSIRSALSLATVMKWKIH